MQVGNSVQSLGGVQGARGRARTTFIRIVSEAKPEQSAGQGCNGRFVGDTGTAEPGGKERLTGTHRRMVSRLLIEAKLNQL